MEFPRILRCLFPKTVKFYPRESIAVVLSPLQKLCLGAAGWFGCVQGRSNLKNMIRFSTAGESHGEALIRVHQEAM